DFLLEATGAGSGLSLPALTSLVGSMSQYSPMHIQVEALSGGTVDLPELTQISGSTILNVDGSGSILNVPTLPTFPGYQITNGAAGHHSSSYLTVTNGGTFEDDSLTSLSYVNVTLENPGPWPCSQITTCTDGAFLLDSTGSFTFSSLTDIDGSSFVTEGYVS